MSAYFEIGPTGSLPTRGTPESAGLDLYTPKPFVLHKGYPVYIDLDVKVEIPEGHFGLLVARSSMGRKGVTLANSMGIIDSDYRGNLGVMLVNHGPDKEVYFDRGDRIAQLVIIPCVISEPEHTTALTSTVRGEGGFGSTGA